MTIPKGTLFPMCGMNLAFNRELIGPAMYFGLMGDGQPVGRYDDMWAGWCMKVYYLYEFFLFTSTNLWYTLINVTIETIFWFTNKETHSLTLSQLPPQQSQLILICCGLMPR